MLTIKHTCRSLESPSFSSTISVAECGNIITPFQSTGNKEILSKDKSWRNVSHPTEMNAMMKRIFLALLSVLLESKTLILCIMCDTPKDKGHTFHKGLKFLIPVTLKGALKIFLSSSHSSRWKVSLSSNPSFSAECLSFQFSGKVWLNYPILPC